MVAVKTGFTPPPVPGMPAPMQPMGGMPPMGGAPARNPFAPIPPMPLAGMPPPPAQPPMAQQSMPQMQQQVSNAPRRKRFGDSLEGMLSRNQGLGSMAAQRRPLPMPPQMMPQPRMVAPGTPMMRTPPMGRGMPRPMREGGIVQYFDNGGGVNTFDPETSTYSIQDLNSGETEQYTYGQTYEDLPADVAYSKQVQENREKLGLEVDDSSAWNLYQKGEHWSQQSQSQEPVEEVEEPVEQIQPVDSVTVQPVDTVDTVTVQPVNTVDTVQQPINYDNFTGNIGSITSGYPEGNQTYEQAALFGPKVNISRYDSNFVQDPATNTLTTTAGPTMTAVSPIGAINLPARPVEIDIFDYLGDPTYGSLLSNEVEEMANGGTVPRQTNIAGQPHGLAYINQDEEALLRSFGGSGIAGPGGIPSYPPQGVISGGGASDAPKTFDSGYKSITTNYTGGRDDDDDDKPSSIGPSGYTSLDAIANQAVQDDDDVSFKHMGKTYDNVSDYHDAIFGDDDSPSYPDTPPPGTGTGTGTGGGSGGGSSSAPPTPVVYRDMYGRTYGSQAEADAANLMIMQAQDDKPDRTIDKEIAGPDLAYDDALALTQGVIPPQFSGAVPPGSQFSYGNIGGIGDTSSGFNLPPAVVDPDVGDDNLRFLNKANMYSIGEYNTDPDSISNIINLNAPVSGTTYPNAPPPGTGTTTTSTTSGIQPASSNIIPESFNPDNNTSTGSPSYSTAVVPGSGTTAQNLNQGLGGADNQNQGNQSTGSTTTGNQNASNKTTGGGDPGYRPPPNAAETEYLQNLLGQFEFDDQGKMVFAEPGTVEKVLNQIVSNLSLGLIDMEDLDNQKVQAVLDAYKETGRFAYDSESGASLDLSETLLGPDGKLDPDKLKAFDEKIKIFQGDGIEPAVTGVYDSEGNIVSYGPEIMNTKDGPVVVNNTDIFGSGTNGGGSDTGTDTGVDTGHTVDDDGNIVCNTPGYVYNPETGVCEPAKVTETSDDVNVNIGSGASGTSFEDVLANVVIPAPDIAPISANIRPMKMGGMAGLNRAADNFIKALAG